MTLPAIDLSPEAIAKRGLARTLHWLLEPDRLQTLDTSTTTQALLDPRVMALVPGLTLTELARRAGMNRSAFSRFAQPGHACERSSIALLCYVMLAAIEDYEHGDLEPPRKPGRPRLPPDPVEAAAVQAALANERRKRRTAARQRQRLAKKATIGSAPPKNPPG